MTQVIKKEAQLLRIYALSKMQHEKKKIYKNLLEFNRMFFSKNIQQIERQRKTASRTNTNRSPNSFKKSELEKALNKAKW